MRRLSTWVVAAIVTLAGFSNIGLAALKPVHTVLSVKASTGKDQVAINFSTETLKEIVINRDPNTDWRLKIIKADGIDVPKEVGPDAYDSKLQGFVLKSIGKPKNKNWTIDYKMIVFVCTKDKTQCYREVHEGSVKA